MSHLFFSVEKMMTIAEDSRFLSQFQEVLISESVWQPRSGPTQLTPYLYLGCKADARDIRNLKHLGITHVVNCAGKSRDNSLLYVNEADIWVYHALLAEDRDDYDILQHLPEVQMIIKHARDYGSKVGHKHYIELYMVIEKGIVLIKFIKIMCIPIPQYLFFIQPES